MSQIESTSEPTTSSSRWQLAPGIDLHLDRCHVIGVLNITEDSFSDGGCYTTVSDALSRVVTMLAEGASMIDVGGESTRPGAEPVDVAEQIRRVVPVIEAIRHRFDVPISIDTTSAVVAGKALDAGATVVNDVSSGGDDPDMLSLVSDRRCGLILMHRRCPPKEDSWSNEYEQEPEYDDVVQDVRLVLQSHVQRAESAGIDRQSLVIDPGLGFGKTVAQNYKLIGLVRSLVTMGLPVLCAASRKSFIGAVTGQTQPRERVAGSVAIACWQALNGVRLFRVHDVAAHVRALRSFDQVGQLAADVLASMTQDEVEVHTGSGTMVPFPPINGGSTRGQ